MPAYAVTHPETQSIEISPMNQERPEASSGDIAFVTLQKLLPTHLLSRVIHWATRVRIPWFKDFFIRFLVRNYPIEMHEAQEENPHAYPSVNAFFTRELKPGARAQPDEPEALISPVDGRIYQFGRITDGRIVQAKGHSYTVQELLGGESTRADVFNNGQFMTIYLAPHNYHRIHMPLAGLLREMVYVPGRLFSVNPATTRALPGLFARNERVASLFAAGFGPFALVKVGALFVGSIETVWAGEITPPNGSRVVVKRYTDVGPERIRLARGAEMGRFNMGSTVILLFPEGGIEWAAGLAPEMPLKMGQRLGRLKG